MSDQSEKIGQKKKIVVVTREDMRECGFNVKSKTKIS